MNSVGGVSPAITQLIEAVGEKAQTDSKIAYAIVGKQLQASRQSGEAAVHLIEQVVDLQRQLSKGHLDVQV
jgi:hypothetical protein